MLAAWLVSRFVTVAPGAFVFWGVFAATLVVLGLALPIHGFQGDSLKVGIALALASWVSLGPLHTPPGPLVVGVLVVGACFVVAIGVIGMVVSLGRADGGGD